MPDRLTKKQKQMVSDLDAISSLVGVDYWNILGFGSKYRTGILMSMTRELIRGEVITMYTLIDEHLGSKICDYMFGNATFIRLWKTKKFQRFNYYVIEKMSLMEKLAFVKDVYKVPRAIASDIEAINALRNALAHAFLPENLRAYRGKNPKAHIQLTGPPYKGTDIFTLAGAQRFVNDAQHVARFVIGELTRKRQKKVSSLPPTPEIAS